MKVHIIGPGVVGKATGALFARFGHIVVFTDKGDVHVAERADIHLVCVPEAAAPDVVRSLCMDGYRVFSDGSQQYLPRIPAGEVVVVRSSVPPGTCQKLSEELRRPIFHNPEFLREATAEADLVESKIAIVGLPKLNWEVSSGSQFLFNGWSVIGDAYTEMGKSVRIIGSTESELLKIANNSYLATLISFWNQLKPIAEKYGVNSHRLARFMVDNDPRISPYGALRHGQPYGGTCLPKDLVQLVEAAGDVPHSLLDAVKLINEGIAR